jgi:hypothetical protein
MQSEDRLLSLKAIKRTLLLSVWVAESGNRRQVAQRLGLGYTNASESLRENISAGKDPEEVHRSRSLRDLRRLRSAVDALIESVENAVI